MATPRRKQKQQDLKDQAGETKKQQVIRRYIQGVSYETYEKND